MGEILEFLWSSVMRTGCRNSSLTSMGNVKNDTHTTTPSPTPRADSTNRLLHFTVRWKQPEVLLIQSS